MTHGMRSVFIASHQPSLYIPRLPMVSKYCCVRYSGVLGSMSAALKSTPCIGSCSMPSTVLGSGIPAAVRIVGATSITWVNWVRISSTRSMCPGQLSTIGLRVPPRCDPTCLPHLNGVFPAHAQAAP